MNGYYSHADYSRWYRQYNLNLRNFTLRLDALRLAMSTIPLNVLADSSIERQMDEIDKKIDDVIPRDFDSGANPLKPSELFFENCKVIYCAISDLIHIPCEVESIYEKEKNRVLKVHRQYKFRERYLFAKKTIEELLAAYPPDTGEVTGIPGEIKAENAYPLSSTAQGT